MATRKGGKRTEGKAAPETRRKRALAAAVPAGALVVNAEKGGTLKLSVQVDEGHLVPYHIAWDELVATFLQRESGTYKMRSVVLVSVAGRRAVEADG